MFFSVSPTYFPFNSAPVGEYNKILVGTSKQSACICNSFTNDVANNVLPVPGGPYNKIPLDE